MKSGVGIWSGVVDDAQARWVVYPYPMGYIPDSGVVDFAGSKYSAESRSAGILAQVDIRIAAGNSVGSTAPVGVPSRLERRIHRRWSVRLGRFDGA
jgi:hypothetical protein